MSYDQRLCSITDLITPSNTNPISAILILCMWQLEQGLILGWKRAMKRVILPCNQSDHYERNVCSNQTRPAICDKLWTQLYRFPFSVWRTKKSIDGIKSSTDMCVTSKTRVSALQSTWHVIWMNSPNIRETLTLQVLSSWLTSRSSAKRYFVVSYKNKGMYKGS